MSLIRFFAHDEIMSAHWGPHYGIGSRISVRTAAATTAIFAGMLVTTYVQSGPFDEGIIHAAHVIGAVSGVGCAAALFMIIHRIESCLYRESLSKQS